jgi:Na+-driven multidrug efflux pump
MRRRAEQLAAPGQLEGVLVNGTAFIAAFTPFLISFASGRIIAQTDMIMVARFGEAATAAFSIPLRIMLLDMVVAFALAPVVSVMVGSARGEHERAATIGRAMTAGAVLAVLLTAAGLIVYPRIVSLVSNDPEIRSLATQATFWLTLAIPARLMQFTASMALHGSGRGRHLIPLNLAGVVLNALLNAALMFGAGHGFQGAYESTFACSYLTMAWSLYLLREPTRGRLFAPLPLGEAARMAARIAPEIGRLASERLHAFATLWAFSAWAGLPGLSAFAVAGEFMFILFMPAIAAMRAAAVQLAPEADRPFPALLASVAPLARSAAALSFVVGAIAVVLAGPLGVGVYNLSPEAMAWWRSFVLLMCLWLPVRAADAFQRGVWQAQGRLGSIFAVDVLAQWLISIPLLVYFLRQGSIKGAWLGLASVDIAAAAILYALGRFTIAPAVSSHSKA